MDDVSLDALLQTFILSAGALVVLALIFGGFVRSVGGAWLDGERRIVLRQYGFIVRGDGYVHGGKQVYRGFAAFGWVRLARYDYGGLHLGSLGFVHQQWPALHGRVMAHFLLRRVDAQLVGTFVGRRFRFNGAELVSSSYADPSPRAWARAS